MPLFSLRFKNNIMKLEDDSHEIKIQTFFFNAYLGIHGAFQTAESAPVCDVFRMKLAADN